MNIPGSTPSRNEPEPHHRWHKGLTRKRVLEGALDLLDREGLEALTMRRLGSELAVEATALYNHVRNKEDLLLGIVELLHRRVELPREDDDWGTAVRFGARSLRDLLLAHPNALPLFVARNVSDPEALRPVEAGLRILRRAGFGQAEAVHALRTLVGYTVGYAAGETGALRQHRGASAREAALQRIWSLPEDEFPTLHELAPFSFANGDEEFEFGLDVIVDGLKAKLSGPTP